MKVLSLFDGISCGMIALERAGIKVDKYIAYEIDTYAIQISAANYPNIEHCGDVTTADFAQFKGFDLLIGGSPCQSLSITQSKTRKHLDGKSKLFYEFVRAKNQVQPKYFLFENVASMNDESKNIISEQLGCFPIYINSADFSAQDRPRLYWTNIPVIGNYEKSTLVLDDILQDVVDEKYYYDCGYEYHGSDKKVIATLNIKGHDILKRVYNPKYKCGALTTCGGGQYAEKGIHERTTSKANAY